MISFLRKRSALAAPGADMHSHLIPAIDDGVQSPQEAFDVIDRLLELGYTKLITTPHIMSDYFGNTSESVRAAYEQFGPLLSERNYTFAFECAAEYYLDERMLQSVARKDKLLTFGDRYVLYETNALSEPLQIKEFIFSLGLLGYKPVLAHPERYQYMSLQKAEEMRDRGVKLQINLLSLTGSYGPAIQRLAEKLIDHRLVDFLGSDCHNLHHAQALEQVFRSSYYKKALDLPLLNRNL